MTHGSPELDEDARKLKAFGVDPGPTFADLEPDMTNGAWLIPPNPKEAADYWVTRRGSDAAPGYDHGLPDIRVRYRWSGDGAWITGYYQGMQRREADRSYLHSNNGWRIEGPAALCENLIGG